MPNTQKLEKIILALIILGALFVRWYRLDSLLGFHYDQGRDALVIRKLITEGKPFLVGPVTGLEGIFLGPLFYLFLAPFYLLGQGDPVVPAMFLSAIHVIVIYILFRLGKTVNLFTAVTAALIYSFSQPLFWLTRWLSNPPPVMVFSSLLLFSLYKIIHNQKQYWLLAAVSLGCAMQFEVASAIFLIPPVLIYVFNKKTSPSKKTVLLSLLIIFASIAPQIMFEFRHGFVMTKNVYQELFLKKTESGYREKIFDKRINLFVSAFGNKLFAYDEKLISLAFPLLLIYSVVTFKKWDSRLTRLLLLFLVSQLVPLLFFRGNHGNVYDYHLAGNFPIFILLVSIIIGSSISPLYGKAIAAIFLSLFIKSNFHIARNSLIAGTDGFSHISLGNQKQAVNWILENSNGEQFNVDAYVPPVIPYSYDYLLLWLGDKRGIHAEQSRVPLLYTLYEQDLPHPDRLEKWLARQMGIGKIEQTVKFGGITVERRKRIQ